MSKKLAIVSTHPIQYYAPVFQLLAKELNLKVFYTAGSELLSKYDHGFKQQIEWDIPLLEGYEYEFLENIATDKGSHHFNGIINLTAIQQLKKFQPDAILVYGWSYSSHLKIMRHFKGKVKVYFRGDSTLLDQRKGWKAILKNIVLKWIYTHVDFAFYVGTANKAYFKKHGLKENQLVFAPHAIDNNRFAKDRTAEATSIREKIGIKATDILLLFAGKLEAKKNPILLLNAFLALNLPNVHLLFAGNGALEESIRTKSEGFNQVHFMPFQNQTQMPVVYQACDLFCLPSKGPGETWGLAVNEAMAAAKAVLVSTKVGCYPDLVTSTTGEVFKSEDLEDLKQKLIALTNDKLTLQTKGSNAANFIQSWSFELQVNAIVNDVNRL